MIPSPLSFRLPSWLVERLRGAPARLTSPEERMQFAVDLARENVSQKTGGPFGAAVFEKESGRLVAAGVNLVTWENCSALHGEMVALMLAQKAVGSYDLGAEGLPAHQLVSSAEPCAMCLGALPWSGVSELLCGARGDDVGALGFDEGEKPLGWANALERRGIRVRGDVLRSEAVEVLRRYADGGGIVYNPRRAAGRDGP